jgi:excisionase family DNA binding protein
MDQATLSKKAAATYLGISLRGLDRLIAQGEIPIIQVGRRILIRRSALNEFLDARERRRGHGEGESETRQ